MEWYLSAIPIAQPLAHTRSQQQCTTTPHHTQHPPIEVYAVQPGNSSEPTYSENARPHIHSQHVASVFQTLNEASAMYIRDLLFALVARCRRAGEVRLECTWHMCRTLYRFKISEKQLDWFNVCSDV